MDIVEIVLTGPADFIERHVADLLDDRLIACAQYVQMSSAYRWQGQVERDVEVRAHLHTTASRAGDVVARIGADHPYDVPCALVLPVVGGLPDYAAWVAQEVAGSGRDLGA